MENKDCCEKCLISFDEGKTWKCNNPSCQCHSKAPEKEMKWQHVKVFTAPEKLTAVNNSSGGQIHVPNVYIKDPNCPICYPKVMGLSPEGWTGVQARHDQGHSKAPCTHSQHPSGAMYCLRPDGCTYRATDTAEKPYRTFEITDKGFQMVEKPTTDTSDSWRERFSQWDYQLRKFHTVGNFISDGIEAFIEKELETARIQGQLNAGFDGAKVYEAGKSVAFSLVRTIAVEMAMEKYEYHSPTLNEFFTRLSTLEGK